MKKAMASILVASFVLPAALASAEDDLPLVLPPHSIVAGKTLGEWSAIWWKWAYAIPATDNPLIDPTGDKAKFGDVGPVFFLAGWFGMPPGPVTRSVTIPAKKFVFFPIENAVDDNIGNGCVTPTTTPCAGRLTVDGLFAQLAGFFNVTALHASIDGIAVGQLFAHREKAPPFAYTYQPTDNLAQAVLGYGGADASGTIFPAVADGYYLMLRPLSSGPHTINFGGTFSGVGSLDITYHITVTEMPSAAPALLVP
jgi:hypothetical protein